MTLIVAVAVAALGVCSLIWPTKAVTLLSVAVTLIGLAGAVGPYLK